MFYMNSNSYPVYRHFPIEDDVVVEDIIIKNSPAETACKTNAAVGYYYQGEAKRYDQNSTNEAQGASTPIVNIDIPMGKFFYSYSKEHENKEQVDDDDTLKDNVHQTFENYKNGSTFYQEKSTDCKNNLPQISTKEAQGACTCKEYQWPKLYDFSQVSFANADDNLKGRTHEIWKYDAPVDAYQQEWHQVSYVPISFSFRPSYNEQKYNGKQCWEQSPRCVKKYLQDNESNIKQTIEKLKLSQHQQISRTQDAGNTDPVTHSYRAYLNEVYQKPAPRETIEKVSTLFNYYKQKQIQQNAYLNSNAPMPSYYSLQNSQRSEWSTHEMRKYNESVGTYQQDHNKQENHGKQTEKISNNVAGPLSQLQQIYPENDIFPNLPPRTQGAGEKNDSLYKELVRNSYLAYLKKVYQEPAPRLANEKMRALFAYYKQKEIQQNAFLQQQAYNNLVAYFRQHQEANKKPPTLEASEKIALFFSYFKQKEILQNAYLNSNAPMDPHYSSHNSRCTVG